MSTSLEHEGKVYLLSEEGHRGKKATQVANMLKELMENPGVPIEFEELCKRAGSKYPADVFACTIALQMVELVDLYRTSQEPKKYFYVWTEE